MEILNQFGVQPVLLAAQVVNFLILLFILNKLLYKPILRVLDERKKRIDDSLKNAEEIELRLQKTNEKIDQMIAEAAKNGQDIIKEASSQAAQIIEEAKQKGVALAGKILHDVQIQAQIEQENLRADLQKEFSKIVMLVVEKVTGKILNLKGQKQLIEKAVKEFET